MRELTWKAEEPAELKVLGREPNGAAAPEPARILELSGRRVHVAAAATVAGGAAVCLEWGGQLVLGQVLSAEPGGFWMEIHHMLLNTAELDWQKQGWPAA